MDDRLSVDAVFRVAYGLESPELREEYLRQVSREDPALYDRVAALLEASGEEPDFLESPAEGVGATIDFVPITERPGTKIGPYKLLEEIGEGGMGVVYMAHQREPVRRKVALKIIKPGMDTKEVICRFQAEEQALAMMDHPNIAKVHDAGTTESGRPYFVMELVNGVPITEYADENNLTTDQRLELLISVCNAVQHAHQKGIIHRDIKPTNILVTLHDGVPVPKIIDFGIAKAINQELTANTMYTGFGQVVGTPIYMSPEQAERSGLDVDTRCDIYSLGVLLYELLTGTTPFDHEQLKEAGLDEMRRMIRELEPQRPSTRVSTMGKAATTVSERRKTSPVELSHALRQEVDWIVMKALEKDRARRYQSAAEFAQDIRRYLRCEPVEACPPSRAYRFSKFVHRNKKACISVSVLVLSTLVALTGIAAASVSQRRLAEREQDVAVQQLRIQRKINDSLTEVARLRGKVALADGDTASALKQVNDHVQRAMALAGSGQVDTTLVAEVRQLADEIDTQEREHRLVKDLDQAWLAKADLVGYWFDYRACIPHYRKALEAYGISVDKTAPNDCAAIINASSSAVRDEILASLYDWYALSTPLCGVYFGPADGPAIIHSIRPYNHRDPTELLKAGDQVVGVAIGNKREMVDTGEMTAGTVFSLLLDARSAIKLRVISQGQESPRTVEFSRGSTARWLESVLKAVDQDSWRQRLREACVVDERVERWEILEKLAESVNFDRQPAKVITRLANELKDVHADERAVGLLRQLWQREPNSVVVSLFLGNMLSSGSIRQPEEAIRYYSAALALRPDSIGLRCNLGDVLAEKRKWDEAAIHYRAAMAIDPKASLGNLAAVLQEKGKWKESLEYYEMADEVESTRIQFRSRASTMMRAHLLAAVGRDKEYRRVCEDALNRLSQTDEPDASCHATRACTIVHEAAQDPHKLVELAKKAVALDPREWKLYALGMAHLRAGELDDATQRFQDSLKISPAWPARYLNWLGLALVACQQQDNAAARQWLKQAVDLMERRPAIFAQDRLEGQILRREVERLLETTSHKDADTKPDKQN